MNEGNNNTEATKANQKEGGRNRKFKKGQISIPKKLFFKYKFKNKTRQKTGETITTYINFKSPIDSVVQKKMVCHSNSMRLHNVSLAVIIVAHIC